MNIPDADFPHVHSVTIRNYLSHELTALSARFLNLRYLTVTSRDLITSPLVEFPHLTHLTTH
ncbi:hypothetical protein FRC17_008575, partial [Serendipita sp. 399]